MENTVTNIKLPNSFSTKEELFALLAEGERARTEGRGRPAREFFKELERDMDNGTL
jgi:hypothetical protein